MLDLTTLETELRCGLAFRESQLIELISTSQMEKHRKYWTSRLALTREIISLIEDSTILTLLKNAEKQEKLQNGPRREKS